ncbi:MAG: dihydroorotase, partial [Bacteroidetes bacterium]|nr:dihydroorotase [Bacteroidota bacterium]
GNLVDVYPVGAISRNLDGIHITEMHDMSQAGAIAFTNTFQKKNNAGLMERALHYVKAFDGVILDQSEELTITENGQVNEGEVSTLLGFKGIPAMAEELMVATHIRLVEHTDSRLHLLNVSSARSIDIIREAKRNGVNVTASVTAYHLMLNETDLLEYDTNYKVNPPLRRKEDVKALRVAIKDGTIDAICSQHIPQDNDSKRLEFEYADFGMIGLETAFAVANKSLDKALNITTLIKKLAIGPRKVLNLETPKVMEGESANLTLFDPREVWIPREEEIRSRSRNTPFLGMELKGKVKAVINNNQMQINS